MAALLTSLPCAAAEQAAGTGWTLTRTDVVARINADLKPGVPTADVAIYYPSNLDPPFAERVSLDGSLIPQFVRAKEIFAAAGVQLKLVWIKTGPVDPQFFEIQSNDMAGRTRLVRTSTCTATACAGARRWRLRRAAPSRPSSSRTRTTTAPSTW
ncbi:MAG: hypothetical protein HC872_04630 [Gammaproteobacteria bacterium]|nr:hypothetical protein [Gammaproteobacteria bacterium]